MKIRNRLLAILLLFVTVFLGWAMSPAGVVKAAAFSLSVDGTREVGATIRVGIVASGGPFSGADGSFSYDSSKLRLESVGQGAYGTGVFEANGNVFVVYNSNFDGTSIAVATFTCIAEGESSITCNLSDIANMDAVSLGSQSASATITITTPVPKSDNANLANLSISPGSLSPAFSADTTSYSAVVGEGVSKLTVSAAAADTKASVSTNGASSLAVGTNAVTVVVTAENGAQKKYTINVERRAGPSPTPSPTPVPLPPIRVQDVEYTALTIENDMIPEGFTRTEFSHNGKKYPALEKTEEVGDGRQGMILVLLSSGNHEEAVFYFYEEVTNSFHLYMVFTAAPSSYILLKDGAPNLPMGYEAILFAYRGLEIVAYRRLDDSADGPILLYMQSYDGQNDFYFYDEETGLIFPFKGDLMAVPTLTPTPEPTPESTTEMSSEITEATETTAETGASGSFVDLSNPFFLAVAGLFVLTFGLFIVFLVLFLRSKRKKEACQIQEDVDKDDLDYVPDDEDVLWNEEETVPELTFEKTEEEPAAVMGDFFSEFGQPDAEFVGVSESVSEAEVESPVQDVVPVVESEVMGLPENAEIISAEADPQESSEAESAEASMPETEPVVVPETEPETEKFPEVPAEEPGNARPEQASVLDPVIMDFPSAEGDPVFMEVSQESAEKNHLLFFDPDYDPFDED